MNQQKFDQINLKRQPPEEKSCGEYIRRFVSGSFDYTHISPMVHQLKRSYEWPSDFFKDFIVGITMGIVNIPQGMAHALVGHLDMVYGLYSNIFPPLIYAGFGDSSVIPIGSSIYTNLIIAKFVDSYSTGMLEGNFYLDVYEGKYRGIEVASTISLLSGIMMIVFSLLQFGALSTFMSDSMLRGFLCGVSFVILVEFLPPSLDLKVVDSGLPFDIVHKILSFLRQLPFANLATALIASTTTLLFLISTFVITPFMKNYTAMVFPIEFLALLFGTTSSWYFKAYEKHNVKIVGAVPNHLPYFHVPTALNLAPKLIQVSVVISLITYLVHLTLAKSIGARNNTRIRDNRELLILGLVNAVSSLVECFPVGDSPCRTLLQVHVGAKSQVSSILSALFVLAGLLWLGHLLYYLPMCILAVIIIFSIAHSLLEISEVVYLWKASKSEAIVWLTTFLFVVFWSMEIGLIVGVILSLFNILYQVARPQTALLGYISNPGVFRNVEYYDVDPIQEPVHIFRFEGPICFLNVRYFENQLYEQVGFRPSDIPTKVSENWIEAQRYCENMSLRRRFSCVVKHQHRIVMNDIILDFSGVSFIDFSGAKTVIKIILDCREVDVLICLASCTESVFNLLRKEKRLKRAIYNVTFPDIRQALKYIRMVRLADSKKYY